MVFTLSGEVSLRRPFARGIKDVTGEVTELSFRRREGSLQLEILGTLEYRITYIGKDNAVRFREGAVAFRRLLTGEWVEEDIPLLASGVDGFEYDLQTFPGREYGEHLTWLARVEVIRLPDAHTPNGPPAPVGASPDFTFTPLQVEELVAERAYDILEERDVTLDIAAFKVIDVQATVSAVDTQMLSDALIINAVLFERIYYVAEDGLIHYQHAEINLERSVEIPAKREMNGRADLRVRSVEFELSSDGCRLSQRIIIGVRVKTTRTMEMEVVTGLPEEEEVRVTREQVRVDTVVGRGTGSTQAEKTVRLPSHGGDTVKAIAAVEEVRAQVVQGQVMVEGIVHVQMFYTCDGIAYHAEDEVGFHGLVPVDGAEPGMNALVEARVGEVAAEVSPADRAAGIRVDLILDARVTEGRTLQVVTAVAGDVLQAEHRHLKVERLVGQTGAQLMLQKRVVLVSKAVAVSRLAGTVLDLSWEIIPDQVIVQGRVHQQVFFVDRRKIERHQTEEIPFSYLVEVPGALPGMKAQVYPRIKHVSSRLAPDGDTFVEKVVLELSVRIEETVDLAVVTDVRGFPRPAVGSGDATGNGSLLPVRGAVHLSRPHAVAVEEVKPALYGTGGFSAVRVHAYYVAPNRLVYHTREDFPLAGSFPVAGVREFRWMPVMEEGGRCREIRWEAIVECSASPST